MSGENWTPGPWRAIQGKHSLQIHSKKHWIANIKCESCPAHEEGSAHLIAAAPTMADYIKRRATEGCEEAAKIWETINAR